MAEDEKIQQFDNEQPSSDAVNNSEISNNSPDNNAEKSPTVTKIESTPVIEKTEQKTEHVQFKN